MWGNSAEVNEQQGTPADFREKVTEDQNEEKTSLKYETQCVFIITYLIIR